LVCAVPVAGFPHLLQVLDYDLENSRTWKVMENHWSWKVLEINAFGFGKSWKNILEFHASFS